MKVATFNLRHHADRWAERFPLVVETLLNSEADLIGLQEVSLKLGEKNQAAIIADAMNARLGRAVYRVYFRECRGTQKGQEGIGILARVPVGRVESIDLPGIWRVALLVEMAWEGGPLALINTHLHHEPALDEVHRFPQAQRIAAWAQAQAMPCIITGDFNARPASTTIQLMKQHYRSAYETFHGREPDYTWPTPLVSGFSPAEMGMIDYIFLPPEVLTVAGCTLIGTEAAAQDAELYPSDHFGIAAEFHPLER